MFGEKRGIRRKAFRALGKVSVTLLPVHPVRDRGAWNPVSIRAHDTKEDASAHDQEAAPGLNAISATLPRASFRRKSDDTVVQGPSISCRVRRYREGSRYFPILLSPAPT